MYKNQWGLHPDALCKSWSGQDPDAMYLYQWGLDPDAQYKSWSGEDPYAL